MEALIEFLKHSTAVDLVIILLVVLIALILIPVGILIAIVSRSRMPIFIFLMFTLAPLLLALLGTYLRLRWIENALAEYPNVGGEVIAMARQEAWITTYIGAAGTALAGLIGLTGLVLTKEKA